MLVYIRESDKEKIICDVDEEEIAEHLRVIFREMNCSSDFVNILVTHFDVSR